MDKEMRQQFIEAVEGENKDRDFLILECSALYPEYTHAEIIKATGIEIGENRVGQILKANSPLLLKLFAQVNPLYFKEGRMMMLVKMFNRKTKAGVYSGKDPSDILEGMRKEVEGDNKTSIGVVINNKEKDEPTLSASDVEFQHRIRADLKASRLL